MLPDPLHPALVHLPIALAVLVPLLGVLALPVIAKSFLPARVWSVVVLLQALLVGSAWLGIETGEDQEERVEKVVAERHIEEHEEAAERFLALAGAGLTIMAVGLLPGRVGSVARVAGAAASLVVLAAAVSVGHSGGELVYQHGAAAAYVDAPGAEGTATAQRLEQGD